MDFIGKTILFIMGVVIGLFLIVYSANVFLDLWGWFALPLGAPALVNKWHGVGLIVIAGYPFTSLMTGIQDIKDILREDTEKPTFLQRFYVKLATSAVLVTLTWGLGAGYHYLMVTNAF